MLGSELKNAIQMRDKGEQYPFVVIDKEKNRIIGSTRFLEIKLEHRKLEIGWTWYQPLYWGKGYNEECKLLLLTYCFEQLKTLRVQLVTWEKNMRSRNAIERIGGKYEGTLRKHVIRHNQEERNTFFFSIIDTEWNDVKPRLTRLMEDRYAKSEERG